MKFRFPKIFHAKQGEDGKAKKKGIVLTPTSVVLATYVLLLLTKLIDVAFINRENEYYSVVILQLMIFLRIRMRLFSSRKM